MSTQQQPRLQKIQKALLNINAKQFPTQLKKQEVDQAVVKMGFTNKKTTEEYIDEILSFIEHQITNINTQRLKNRSLQEIKERIRGNQEMIGALLPLLQQRVQSQKRQKLKNLLDKLNTNNLNDNDLKTLLQSKIQQLEPLLKKGDIIKYEEKISQIKKDIPLVSDQLIKSNLKGELVVKKIELEPHTKQAFKTHLENIKNYIDNTKAQSNKVKIAKIQRNLNLIDSHIDRVVDNLKMKSTPIIISDNQKDQIKRQIKDKFPNRPNNQMKIQQQPPSLSTPNTGSSDLTIPWWKRWFFFWM